MNAKAKIRAGRLDDLPALTSLYNHYIETTPITFDIRPHMVEERRSWFQAFKSSGRYRLFVATENAALVGFAYSAPLRSRAAYISSVETTVYVAPGLVGRGFGTRLYATLFDGLKGADVHRAYAAITLPNPASEALHRKHGFVPAGVFHEVGRKFGRFWDVAWWEKPLDG